MAVLITGGTGFIGSSLANKLSEMGMEVFISGFDGEQKPKCKARLNLAYDWKILKDAGLNTVYHLAANNNTLDTDKDGMFAANVKDAMTVFHKALDIGCKKFVYASSTAIYGNSPAPYIEDKTPIKPLNVYAESKARLEEYASYFANMNQVNMVGLRFCNVYGPGEGHKGKRASMIYQLYHQMCDGINPKIFTDGTQKRDWLYVEDACSCLLAASMLNGIDVFNCGSGQAVSFINLVQILNAHLFTAYEPEFIHNPYVAAYQSYTECNMTKAKEKLGFVPQYDVAKGVKYLGL